MHLFLKKMWNSNQKHLSCKKSCAKTDEKDVKSKEGSQGLYRKAVDHINNFDNDDPGHKTLECLGHHHQIF